MTLVMACGSSDPPVKPGFECGGFGGYECPPASTCVMDPCDHSDCPATCMATTKCNPAHDDCPNATICDASTDRCMPRKICKTKADCYPDEACLAGPPDSPRFYAFRICGRG